MSKGNLFLGYARGKVGSVVFSRLYGQQITRAYNANPANPKTYAQSRQRMLFSSISQYYRSFRYLIEQGQQGIDVGQKSVQEWQKKSLRLLSQIATNGVLMPNVYGVQYPQLLPISLTDGNLPALDYTITGKTNTAGDTHYYITLPFKGRYTTTPQLAGMTLRDFYDIYPTIQQGAQLTFVALAWSVDYDVLALYNRAYQPIWCQYVLSSEADLSQLFFVESSITGRYIVNPAILQNSWGERFDPEIYLEVVDGKAVARIGESDFVTDGSGGIIAGAVITSYYNGTQWARSNSPFAIAPGYATRDIDAIIETYQKASKDTSSDLYLNQSKARSEQYDPALAPVSFTAIVGSRTQDLTNLMGATFVANDGENIVVEVRYGFDITDYSPNVLINVNIQGDYTTYDITRQKEGNSVRFTFTPSTTTSDGQLTAFTLTTLDGQSRILTVTWQE